MKGVIRAKPALACNIINKSHWIPRSSRGMTKVGKGR